MDHEAMKNDGACSRRRSKNAFPKHCSCGVMYSVRDWITLRPHGVFRGTDESTGRRFGDDLEIRVCVCGSSMAVKLMNDEGYIPSGDE